MMNRRICLDMDGTFVNLYGVENWLPMLRNEETTPYEVAKPLVNLSLMARYLNRLQREGYTLTIISWTAKNGTEEYNHRVAQAKMEWLAKHLKSVNFDEIHIVEYGTPKENFGNETDILFDDEIKNRENWNGTAYDVENILEILKNLLDKQQKPCYNKYIKRERE